MERTDGMVVRTSADTVVVDVDESIYTLEILFRACYMFTDRAYLYLRREKQGHVTVHITTKEQVDDPSRLAGEFVNELLDYRVRSLVSAESGKIRELIVAEAFAEGSLLDEPSEDDTLNQDSDPLGIGYYHERKK